MCRIFSLPPSSVLLNCHLRVPGIWIIRGSRIILFSYCSRRFLRSIMASLREPKYSLVEFFERSTEGTKCGYCGAKERSYSTGMWGYRLTVTDYQYLLHRGWRRSGKYLYKPTMHQTCCPQYAIRCDALDFRPSKSHKKVIKKMYKFLAIGLGDDKIGPVHEGQLHTKKRSAGDTEDEDEDGDEGDVDMDYIQMEPRMHMEDPRNEPDLNDVSSMLPADSSGSRTGTGYDSPISLKPNRDAGYQSGEPVRVQGPQMKKKDLRRERARQKLLDKGLDPDIEMAKRQTSSSAPADITSLLDTPLPENPKHVLRSRLVMLDTDRDPYFESSFEAVYKVYQKYELTIHSRDAERPTVKQFSRFLTDSPLQYQLSMVQNTKEQPVYGSFHLHYILDDTLIAVDVIDILPDCVTSVYFFYDPDYRYLSLGTYSVLKEMAMVQELNKRYPEIKYTSLGFYVHSCPKMQYKANFHPSSLLCPEKYTWHSLTECLPRLDVAAYQRLGDVNTEDEDGKTSASGALPLILFKRVLMTYEVYIATLRRNLRPATDVIAEQERVAEFAYLVGTKCLGRMALYCDNAPINQGH